MLNGMELPRSIHRLVDWIHQAGDSEQREQHQGGKAQVVKDSRQRGRSMSAITAWWSSDLFQSRCRFRSRRPDPLRFLKREGVSC